MTAVQLHFFTKAAKDGKAEKERPIVSLRSSEGFQARHLLADCGFALARQHPSLSGQFPATLAWKDGLPTIEASCNGIDVSERYPMAALRGGEALRSQRPDLLTTTGNILYKAGPAPEAEAKDEGKEAPKRRQGGFRLAAVKGPGDEECEACNDLRVLIPEYPVSAEPLPLGDYLQLGGEHLNRSDMPVVCRPELLLDIAKDEALQVEFRERGWYLIGEVVRNGASGDLVAVVDGALRAEHTTGTTSTLVWSEETKVDIAQRLTRARRPGYTPRLVGWLHTHDIDSIDVEGEENESAEIRAGTKPTDNRFFSELDRTLQRRDWGPDSVAVVLDAAAARRDPSNLGRCFAVFGTARGVVVRRGLHLGARDIGNALSNLGETAVSSPVAV